MHAEHVLDLEIPISYPELLNLISSWSGFQNYCDEHKLSVESGIEVLDKEMSDYIDEEEKAKDHVLSYSCTMVSAVKD